MKQIPNLLSLSRVAAAPLAFWLLSSGNKSAFIIVLLIAGLTDYLDGWVARRFHFESRLGLVLDSVTDKVLVIVTVLALLNAHYLSWTDLILLLVRDIGVLAGAAVILIVNKRMAEISNIQHSWPSRICTFFQFLTLGAFLLGWAPHLFLAIAVISGILADIGYLENARAALSQKKKAAS